MHGSEDDRRWVESPRIRRRACNKKKKRWGESKKEEERVGGRVEEGGNSCRCCGESRARGGVLAHLERRWRGVLFFVFVF